MKKLILFLLINVVAGGIFAQTTPTEMITLLGKGINLGNTLELDGQDERYEWVNEYYFKDYKNVGFQNVRLPVKWHYHTMKEAPYTIDAEWLARVDTIIDMAIDNGLLVVLNAHHEDWLIDHFYEPDSLDRFVAIWSQVSDYFQDKTDSLVFEIINEPYFTLDSLEVDSINHLCLAEIRENNPTRNVMICSGEQGNNDSGGSEIITNLNLPDDDYIIAWWHYYKPGSFTIQEGEQETWGSQEDYENMARHFDIVKAWSDSTGVPIYTGEFGVKHNREMEYRLLWYENIVRLNEEKGFASAVWDDNPGQEVNNGIFSYYRGEGFWIKEHLIKLTGYTISQPQVISIAAGNWSDPSIWNTGSVPLAGDHVLVQHLVHIDMDIKVARIVISDVVIDAKLSWVSTTQGYTIEITNDFVAEGYVDLNDGSNFDVELKFTGSDTSYIRTTPVYIGSKNEFGPITIEKSGEGMVIIEEGVVASKDTLTLNSGLLKIMPEANYLSLHVSKNLFANASDISHVIGSYGRLLNSGNYAYFPIGDGTKYRPIGIKGNDFYDSNTEWIEAEVIPESATAISSNYNEPILGVSDLRHWKLTSRNADVGTITGFSLSYNDDDGFAEGDLTASIAYLTSEPEDSIEVNKWYQNLHPVDSVEFMQPPNSIEGEVLDTGYILNLTDGESIYAALAEVPPPPPAPSPGDLIITEVNSHEIAQASWVEIFNNSGTEISLEGVQFSHFTEGLPDPNGTLSLTGTIDSAEFIIVARNMEEFETSYGFAADYGLGGLTLNPETDGLLLEHETVGIIDQMNTIPAPDPRTPITDDALYLRKDFTSDGSDLANHWCVIIEQKNGTPGLPNVVSWQTTGTDEWHIDTNWSDTFPPCECVDVFIPSGGTQPIISQSGALAKNIEVSTDALLTLTPTGELSIFGGLTSSATDTLVILQSDQNSSSSLVLNEKNTSSGIIKYERYLRNDIWHLASSPVVGETYNLAFFEANFIDKNPAADEYALLDYNTTSNLWNPFSTSASNAPFNSGQGYLMARVEEGTAGGNVSFVGELADNDTSFFVSTEGARWNAVGNPFTSAIGINDLTGPNNFIDTNSMEGLDPNYVAIYYWNDTTGQYIPVNHSTDSASYALPGQGFFIKAKSGASQIVFPMTLQSHQPDAGFNSTRNQQLTLTASTENQSSSSTQIKFLDNMTAGLDIGYDAGKIKGNTELNLYTKLVDDNGIDFAVQCLPKQGVKDLEIPLGMDLTEFGSITFSIEKIEFPENLVPVLEDKVLDTKRAFSDPGDIYATVVNENGYGRFYLSFSSTTDVNTLESATTNYKVWYGNRFIQISGNYEPNTMVSVYDVNGRLLKQQELTDLQVNQLETGFANAGVYLVRITSKNASEVHKVSIVK